VKRHIIFSIHDVTPAFSAEVREAADLLRRIGVGKLSLLAVPDYHGIALDSDTAFLDWLHDSVAFGDEIVLHGLRHVEYQKPRGLMRLVRRALLTRGEGEFLGVEPAIAGAWLDEGSAVLRKNGFATKGFVAPAWLMERSLLPELCRRGFLYTTNLTHLIDLRNDERIPAPTFVLKGGSRVMSRLSRAYNNILIPLRSRRSIIRLAIHPTDIRYGAEAWLKNIVPKLMKDRCVTTYAEIIESRTG